MSSGQNISASKGAATPARSGGATPERGNANDRPESPGALTELCLQIKWKNLIPSFRSF